MKPFKTIASAFVAFGLASTSLTPAALAHPHHNDDRRGHNDRHNELYGGNDKRGSSVRGDHDRRRHETHKRHDNIHRDRRYQNHNYNKAWDRADYHYDRHNAKRYYRISHGHRYDERLFNPRYSGSRYYIGGHYKRHPRSTIIRDHHRYGLHSPPRGHHWVHDRDNDDAILVGIATGAIIGLVIGAAIADDDHGHKNKRHHRRW